MCLRISGYSYEASVAGEEVRRGVAHQSSSRGLGQDVELENNDIIK